MEIRIEARPADEDACRAGAESIFRAALDRVDPAALVARAVAVEGAGGRRELVARAGGEEERFDLGRFDRILVAGMGKASASMAAGLEASLGSLIEGGLVVVKDGCGERLERIEVTEASHPVPDERSEKAARDILALGRGAGERTLFIVLVSGGGSALLCAPAEGIRLADKALTTSLLLACGATIQEVNCVRKHLSAVKGGRLAAALAPATVLSLVLSDVVGDDLDAIASGPTVPDASTWADALEIVSRRGILGELPAGAAEALRRGASGESPDTPKPGDPAFARSRSLVIGSNRLALAAAERRARELGFNALVLSSRLAGEAREAALFILGIGEDIAASGFPLRRPACLLLGGETTVTLRGGGKGGRNQELALAFLAAMERNPAASEGLFLLSASTDGSDGPTDAAGAFASAPLLREARRLGMDPREYLSRNDSYSFHDRLGSLLRTGPTKTNVCDLQVLLAP
jgi:glycerate 2-kinase